MTDTPGKITAEQETATVGPQPSGKGPISSIAEELSVQLITTIAFLCCLMLVPIFDQPNKNTDQGVPELSNLDVSTSRISKPINTKPELSGQKLAAFREVVDHWKEFLESSGDVATKAQWLQKTQKSQEKFISIPFNPKSNSRSLQEGKDLLKTFIGELKEVAETMSSYNEADNGFEATHELALWKILTKHFDELFNKKKNRPS